MQWYREDLNRYWKIRRIRSAARIFSRSADEGFVEWLGEVDEEELEEVRSEVGTFFYQSAQRLGKVERKLDEALSERESAKIEKKEAAREQKAAKEALREPVMTARELVRSLTRGRVKLGGKGSTPRESEKLAGWSRILSEELFDLELEAAVRPIVLALAKEIQPLAEALEAAFDRKQSADLRLKYANDYLRSVRRKVDEEIGQVKRFLESSLTMVGYEGLARKVLGKRRGRPRKSLRARKALGEEARQATEAGRKHDLASTRSEKAGQELDFAPRQTEKAGQEYGLAPTRRQKAGQKFDSEPESTVLGAGTELQEIEEAPIEASPALQETEEAPIEASPAIQETEEAPSQALPAVQKITEGPCKPCTELQKNGEGLDEGEEVVSFQEDTPRSRRRRRRRGASALLRVPARWFSSGWVGRFVSKDRWQRKGGAGGGVV